jgi:hypothetical protein
MTAEHGASWLPRCVATTPKDLAPGSVAMPCVSRGTIYRQKGTLNWSIKIHVDGQPRRETTGTADPDEARAFLHRRIDEVSRGLYTPVGQRISFEEMCGLLFRNYEFKRNRTDPKVRVRRLADFFREMLGEQITGMPAFAV